MKKKFLLLLCLCLFCVTGCGKKDYYKEAQEKMNQLESYQAVMNLTIGVKAEGVEVELPMSMDMKIDTKNQIMKMQTTMTLLGETMTFNGYTDYKNKVSYIMYEEAEEWVKSSTEATQDEFLLKSFWDEALEVKKLSSDDDKVSYQLTVPKSTVQAILKETSSTEDMNYEFVSDVVANLEIDKKTGYVTRMYMDLLSSIKMDSEGATLSKMNIEYLFSNFNAVGPIIIDQGIIDNALDENEIVDDAKEGAAIDSAYSYIIALESAMGNAVLQDSKIDIENAIFNGENLISNGTTYPLTIHYSGTMPTNVNLIIKNGVVEGGSLTINGFVLQVSDTGVVTAK